VSSARLRHRGAIRMNAMEWAAVVTACAAVVNAVSVVILALITRQYARSTKAILEESKKARSAAESQASAASLSVSLLQRQIEEQFGLGQSIVASAVESLMKQIEYWKSQDIKKLALCNGLPPTTDLVPPIFQAAVEHARRISPVAGEALLKASDEVKLAKNAIESIRGIVPESGHGLGIYDAAAKDFDSRLTGAFELIVEAQKILL